MSNNLRNLALIAAITGSLLPATAVHAQYYNSNAQPAPLYPYVVQSERPYAVQVAPNTYVIERNAPAYPYMRSQSSGRRAGNPSPELTAPRFDRPHKPVNHALVEELRKRAQINREQANRDQGNRAIVDTQQVVRDPPVVVETKRFVDDPPRIIERPVIVEDGPVRAHHKRGIIGEIENTNERPSRDDNKKRVIQADAEVTILGPDRMSIRLFRKGQGPKAGAHED